MLEGIKILNNIIYDIVNNNIIVVGFISWVTAQAIKIITYFIINKKFVLERLIGAGGMPSSHSALVCSTCMATYKECGADSAVFALSLILAGIVMYDAMGVRRAAGEQAKVINKVIITKINDQSANDQSNGEKIENIVFKNLKEFLGHTPLEVLGGAILGIVVSLIY